MSKIEDKAVNLLEKLEKLSEQYAPETMDAALGAVQVSAAGGLIYGLLGLAICLLAYKPMRKLINWGKKCRDIETDWSKRFDIDMGLFISLVIYFVVALCLAVGSIFSLFDIWNWVGILNPKLALAHQVMGL